MLNRESGLLGVSGLSADMRVLERSDDPRAALAIETFCYWAVRQAGAMIAAMGGVDAIAFTGGVGENAPTVRAAICQGLAFTGVKLRDQGAADPSGRCHAIDSTVSVFVVPADEESVIAGQTRGVLGNAA